MSATILTLLALVSVVRCHTVITYPGWRGNNLITNATFPFGMGWSYPCGGIGPTANRTAWPLDGTGALAFQPGWFAGHLQNLMYVNLCLGAEPQNCSLPMVPVFELRGPSNNPYPGTVCLQSIPLPEGIRPQKGDLASIQLVQTPRHGGAQYSCADIIFTDDAAEVPPVTVDNCFNSSDISVSKVRIVAESAGPTAPTGVSPPSTSGAPPATSTPAGSGAASVDASAVGQLSALLMFLRLM
ncbi:hypothetical protein B0T14DRAFT_461691 [Immersiella caudata]|uniref:Copper acquisition factor BIM1-like domain-containing protein n=1 Tax=Immersiella caudata TaxID=314043 RepID=A0AA39WE42_9PEZI|nr:hypothetical protein B0T14DRAFT_461691 [Immersiella caudata]